MVFNYYNECFDDLPEVTIGNRIRKQRLLKSVSMVDLARAIQISSGMLDTYEFDRAFPSPKVLVKIAEFLHVPINYFCDEYYEFIIAGFSKKLEFWRLNNNLTLRAASRLLGIHSDTLSKWERELAIPDRNKLLELKFILEE